MTSNTLIDNFTISSEQLAANIVGAHACGLEVAPFLEQCGIAPDFALNSHIRIPHSHFIQLRLLLCKVLDDENAGFLPTTSRWGTLVYLCRSVIASHSLSGVLNRFSQFHQLFSPDIVYELYEEGELAYIRLSIINSNVLDNHAFYENSILFLLSFSLWLIDYPFVPQRIDYSFSKPGYARDYANVVPCEYRFEQPVTQLVFDRTLLKKAIKRPAEDLPLFLNNHLYYLLEKNLASGALSDRVRRLLSSSAGISASSVEVANLLKVSEATLRRKLAAEGTSFKAIKDAVRQELALYYLFEKNIAVVDVAPLTGFSEASAFSRAFKQWTGYSPSHYPQQQSPSEP